VLLATRTRGLENIRMDRSSTIQVANYIKKSNLARDVKCPINYSDVILNLGHLSANNIPVSGPIPSGLYGSWFVSYAAKMQSGIRGSYFQADPRISRNRQAPSYHGAEWAGGKQLMRQTLEAYINPEEAEQIIHNNKVRHFLRSANFLGMTSVLEFFRNTMTLYVPKQWNDESNLAESYTGYSPQKLGMATLNYAGIKQQGLV